MNGALTRGVLIVGSSRFIVNLFGMLSSIVLARLLTPADVGLVAIAGTISTLVISLTEFPLSSLLLQLDVIDREHFDTAWTVGFLRVLAISALLAILAVPVAVVYDDERLLAIMLAIAGGTILGGFRSPRLIEYSKHLRFDVENKILVLQRLLGTVGSLWVAYETHSYWALLVSTYASDLTGVVLSHLYAPHRLRFSKKFIRFFLTQGFWLSLTQILGTLTQRADPLLIGYFTSQSVLGQYTIGANLANIPTRETIAPLAQPLLPSLARSRHDIALTRSTYTKAQAFLFAVAFPAGIGMSQLAPFLVPGFLGERWTPAIPVVQVLAALSAVQMLGALAPQIALARSENKLLSQRSSLMFAVRVPAVALGVVLGGLPGCLIGMSVAACIAVLVNLLLARRLIALSITEQLVPNLNTFLATLVMSAVIVIVQSDVVGASGSAVASCFALAAVGIVAYAAARLLLVLMSPVAPIVETELWGLLKRSKASR